MISASPLTSRLYGRQSSSCSLASSSSSSGSISDKGSNEKPKSLSGYSADAENTVSRPPLMISSYHHRHKRRITDAEEQAKRKKMNDAQFAASRARSELTKSGLPCPTLKIGKYSRVIPMGQVDMTNVKLVDSKTVESSPFLTPPPPTRLHDFATDFGDAYKELVVACSHYYRQKTYRPHVQESPNYESSDDSSSSLSDDPDSDDCRSSPVVVIGARLDDTIDTDAKAKAKVHSSPGCHLVSCPESMSLEQALEPRNEPRLVTNSFAPFSVVFGNAAYSRLSGLPSGSVLGKPLVELLGAVSAEKFSLASCAASSGQGCDVAVQILGSKDSIKCAMKVSPVVSSAQQRQEQAVGGALHEVNNVTHFVIDFNVDAVAEHRNIVLEPQPVQKHALVVG